MMLVQSLFLSVRRARRRRRLVIGVAMPRLRYL